MSHRVQPWVLEAVADIIPALQTQVAKIRGSRVGEEAVIDRL